jgi:SM-20-related protein
MALLNLDKLAAAKVETEPYLYTIIPAFISRDTVAAINATYPNIEKGGSYPIESLAENMAIKAVIDELDGPAFETLIEEKFDVSLSGRPKMYSLRGYTRAKDGQIHTDSKDKIITVLLYLNQDWTQDGGRLRVLKNGHNVDTSWHGHHPFEGQRRSLQMNWMTSEGSKGFHAIRHKISAAVKKLTTA